MRLMVHSSQTIQAFTYPATVHPSKPQSSAHGRPAGPAKTLFAATGLKKHPPRCSNSVKMLLIHGGDHNAAHGRRSAAHMLIAFLLLLLQQFTLQCKYFSGHRP